MADSDDFFSSAEQLRQEQQDFVEQREREARALEAARDEFTERFHTLARESAARLRTAGVPLRRVPLEPAAPRPTPPASRIARVFWAPPPQPEVPYLRAWKWSWLKQNKREYTHIGRYASWGGHYAYGDKVGEWKGFPILLLDESGGVTIGVSAAYESLGSKNEFRDYAYQPGVGDGIRLGAGDRIDRITPEGLTGIMGEDHYPYATAGGAEYARQQAATDQWNAEARSSCLQRLAAGVLHMIENPAAE
ncbi:hypothetical protein [Streptomyces gilvus]|uniref:hypothetical protein n=1 Tax=Streptomyces gilvus TaxID=2920937 RepID=UPI001F0EBB14|nr:hypothetical protein [Streptomyces sp. CME 23]MCH5677351.1 hypothetical protein [Streptomyces sp. CME 23]